MASDHGFIEIMCISCNVSNNRGFDWSGAEIVIKSINIVVTMKNDALKLGSTHNPSFI